MGMVGTTPARGRVLLVGDAAGLVNPLQGEGIAQAMGSGRAAAEAVLAGPGSAAARYRRIVGVTYGPYQSITAPVHATLLTRPRAVAAVGPAADGAGRGPGRCPAAGRCSGTTCSTGRPRARPGRWRPSPPSPGAP